MQNPNDWKSLKYLLRVSISVFHMAISSVLSGAFEHFLGIVTKVICLLQVCL